jgi:hypothetical protein
MASRAHLTCLARTLNCKVSAKGLRDKPAKKNFYRNLRKRILLLRGQQIDGVLPSFNSSGRPAAGSEPPTAVDDPYTWLSHGCFGAKAKRAFLCSANSACSTNLELEPTHLLGASGIIEQYFGILGADILLYVL